jgi:hypothetical protein
VTRSLLVAGVLLLAIGAGMLGMVLFDRPNPYGDAATRPLLVEEESEGVPSRLWSVGGGLSLAAGAACVGLGLNRWRQPR